MTMLGAIIRNRAFWQKVDDRTIKVEVIPSATAMLTAYTDELVKAMREDDSPPLHGR